MVTATDEVTLIIKKVPLTFSVLLFGHIKEKEAGFNEPGFNFLLIIDLR